jgi:hypothetical protein
VFSGLRTTLTKTFRSGWMYAGVRKISEAILPDEPEAAALFRKRVAAQHVSLQRLSPGVRVNCVSLQRFWSNDDR